MINVITFPMYREVNFLLRKHNITNETVSKALIRETLSEIRKTHGKFNESHFKTVLQLLSHDWQPSDIPILLPRRSF